MRESRAAAGTRDARSSFVRTATIFALVLSAATAVAQDRDRDVSPPLATLAFAPGVATLDAPARAQLRDVAAWAREHPWRVLFVEGYADRRGQRSANLALSQDRTDAAVTALVELGIDPQRIVGTAHGDDAPATGRLVIVRATTNDFRDLVRSASPPVR